MLSLAHIGFAGLFGALLVGWLVVVVRGMYLATPIYIMIQCVLKRILHKKKSPSQLVVPRLLQSNEEGEIGEEGWSAIRRAVKRLSEAWVGQISVRTRRTAMRAARRDDLKAIWEIAFFWVVSSEMGDQADVVFKEDKDGDGEPALMSQIIEMTEEEWAEERRENWEEDSGEDADEDSESE